MRVLSEDDHPALSLAARRAASSERIGVDLERVHVRHAVEEVAQQLRRHLDVGLGRAALLAPGVAADGEVEGGDRRAAALDVDAADVAAVRGLGEHAHAAGETVVARRAEHALVRATLLKVRIAQVVMRHQARRLEVQLHEQVWEVAEPEHAQPRSRRLGGSLRLRAAEQDARVAPERLLVPLVRARYVALVPAAHQLSRLVAVDAPGLLAGMLQRAPPMRRVRDALSVAERGRPCRWVVAVS
mmetsp:Transcript_30606/g.99238  ORF Transcript_30606/g.99238 Transcript_30606/m.99238 type:complete len:243 (+) Transcript_30606:133-861(+)